MADLKDFGVVKSWYEAYKKVNEEKKPEDEKKKSPVEVLPKEDNKEEEKKPEEKSEGGEVEKLKAEIERLKGEVQKKDLEVKKKDAETTVEPNAVTGEVPLRVGIAQSILDKKKKKEVKEETLESVEELEEGIKPYVSMIKKDVGGRRVMHYRVLDKDEKEILVTTDKGEAEKFLSKNYNKLRSGSMKPVKEEAELDESTVAVYDVSYDDMPKNKLAQSAKKFKIRLKNLPRNKVQFGGDAAIEFTGSDSDLLKFFKQHFGSTARNIRDLKKELGESFEELEEGVLEKILKISQSNRPEDVKDAKGRVIKKLTPKGAQKFLKSLNDPLTGKSVFDRLPKSGGPTGRDDIGRITRGQPEQQLIDKLKSFKEELDEGKSLNDLKKMLDRTTLLTSKEKKEIESLEKTMGSKGYEKVLRKMFSENLNEARDLNAIDYARRLSTYAVKFGGIDKRDFMKVADKLSDAKNDNDLKKIGKQVDSLDTEPRDLIKGSVALLMGPKAYLKMFGDRLTARDMNVYKDMTPYSLREETLDEVNKDAVGTITTSQMNRLKSAYNSLPDRIDPEKSMALAKMLDRFGEGELRQLVKPDIKFISTLAVNKLIMKHGYKAKDIHDIRNEK